MDENGVINMKQVKHESGPPKIFWLNLYEFPNGEDLSVDKESNKVKEDIKKC